MTPPRGSRRLMQGAALAAALAMVGPVVAEPQTKQAGAAPQPTIEELMRRLEERDALIGDLQRRVEALERQIATTADRAPPNPQPGAAKPVPSVPPVASSAEQEPSTQAEEAPVAAGSAAPAAAGQFEVDEGAAERALERTLVVTGALLLPFGQADIQPSFTYIRSEQEAPTFFSEQGRQFIASQDRAFSPERPQWVACCRSACSVFDGYPKRGSLDLGLLRLRCEARREEKLATFSCKRRGVRCQSCGAPRVS